MTSSILATGEWTDTGALPTATAWHGQHDGAVLLPNGTVLVTGGAGASGAGSTGAAVYDPQAGTWTPTTEAMQTARRLHTATLLDNGKVLVVGGVSGAATFPETGLATAELYDPGTGQWTTTGALHGPRWGHAAVLLGDNTVLVTGGVTTRSSQSERALNTAELYDPDTGQWTETTPMTDARAGHAAVLLGNGQVLVCGGAVPVAEREMAPLAFCELYNPDAQPEPTWTATGNLRVPRSRHQATPLSATSVLVTGGDPPGPAGDGTVGVFSVAEAERYDQNTKKWTSVKEMPGGRTAHRAVPLGQGKVLVVGGAAGFRDDAGYESALVYDSTQNDWATAGGLTTGRFAFAAAALSDSTVLVAGGVVRAGIAAADPDTDELTATTEIFDLGSTP
jgi:N-acetylneuraminic acid mutarotase